MTNPNDPPPRPRYAARRGTIPTWAYRRLRAHRHFQELLAFYMDLSIYVCGWDGEGWKQQEELVEITSLSLATVKRRVSDLKKLGVVVIRRKKMANGHMGPNHYVLLEDDPDLLPPDTTAHHSSPKVSPGGGEPQLTQGELVPQLTQGEPSYVNTSTEPKNNGDSLRSSPSAPASPPPVGAQIALIPDEILDGVVVDETANLPAVTGPNAGVLTKKWGEWCEGRGVKLPERHIKRYAKEIKEAIEQGFTQELIGAALQSMARDRLFDQPHLLPNHLTRVQAGPSLPPERVGHAEASRIRQAHDRGERPDQAAARMRAFLADIAPKEYR